MSSLLEQLRAALAPQYEVERELASGGMGTVFLARDPNLDRPVAIKILRPDLASDTASDRFLREARILARLSHPNVVPVFQAGEADGLSYYVMEYVEGATLRERLERGAMSKEEALKLANDLLSALEEAHKHGVVHRDVKPSNIFLVGDRALLGDFGIAKPTEGPSEGLTASDQRIGSPGYMPPEQLFNEEITPATDIYAAALVICEALTGRQWSMVPRAEEADWSGVPSELVAPLQRALAFASEERWQEAASFRSALGRSQQRARRRVVIAAAGAGAALVLAAGWFASKATFGPGAPDAMGDRPAAELGSVASGVPTIVRKQVTFTGQARSPAIAPDGATVAFLCDSAGIKRLMVQAIDGGEALEILRTGEVLGPRWSRDGSEILVTAARMNLDTLTEAGHYAVPRLGGEPRFVLKALYRTESPGGSRIAYAGAVFTTFWIRDLASGDRTTVRLSEDSVWFRDLRWSPAADVIAVSTVGTDGRYKTIWTVTADGTQKNKVVEDTVDLSSPRWSPEGDALYYNRAGQLWRIDVDLATGAPSHPGPGRWTGTEIEGEFDISDDGKRLVYAETAGGSNLWVVDLTGSAGEPAPVRPLTRGTSAKSGPRISPDGRRVAFHDIAAEGIFTVPLEGGPARLISKPVAGHHLAWSPDGRSLAFVSGKDGAFRVSVVAAVGGPPRRFDASLTHLRAHLAWCAGSILYQQPGNRNFQILDPETGAERPLVDNDSVGWMFVPKCSPDGKRVAVYWNRAPDRGVWAVSLADGSQSPLLRGAFFHPVGWSPDGRWIYARVHNSSEILRVPTTGGPADTVTKLPFEPTLIGLGNLHFGGEHFVANVGERLTDIWLLENFDRSKR